MLEKDKKFLKKFEKFIKIKKNEQKRAFKKTTVLQRSITF